ncbi:MAG: M1 family metallopeptidase [Cyclobacteriaceae bacterium]
MKMRIEILIDFIYNRFFTKKLYLSVFIVVLLLAPFCLQAQFDGRRFEQLETLLPTPNVYRNADGAPGPQYWQQQADYNIVAELNDEDQSISGFEEITYHNYAPTPLKYLWIQLDQNMMHPESDTYKSATNSISKGFTSQELVNMTGHNYDMGYKILAVKDQEGNDLPHTINKTMMRIDLPNEIEPGAKYTFSIKWFYYINDRMRLGGRCGYEYFDDGNYLYTIAQWFPRMCVYDDIEGWQNKQFLGRGEFALPFGNYEVKMTVPADHIVAATGELQNPDEVLTPTQISLLEKAKTAAEPIMIVNQEEAEAKEKEKSTAKKTWHYSAKNVRDFALGSSRKYIWDAMGVDINGSNVMAMSYYPKEANPLYEEYSTRVVAHTLEIYSQYTIDYPYPVAISVEASNGMEYPMICFNYGRPDKNGKYTEALKHGMISVVIHEVGHNFFPMIVNSDERQWSWMDEGLNSFVQYLAEKAWDPEYPSRRGPAANIIPYMKGEKDTMVPIMTNSEQIKQFGNNAYSKPATALNILRESIMGTELFDFAFKEYSRRWAFRHPTPADFFRTMEDASSVDLDWFWKGWFYTTDHVDIAISDVIWYKYKADEVPQEEADAKSKRRKAKSEQARTLAEGEVVTEENKLKYYRPLNFNMDEKNEILKPGLNFYELHFKNIGGLVMPIFLQINYRDGSTERLNLPAEVWRLNENEISKVITREKEIESIVLDPDAATADVDESNNHFPPKEIPSKFDQFKNKSN